MKKLIFALICLLLAVPCRAKIIYVDADAADPNTGLSRSDAYNYLQDSLSFFIGPIVRSQPAPVDKSLTYQERIKTVKSNDIAGLSDPDRDKTIFLKSRTFKPGRGVDPALNILRLPKRPHLFIQFDNIPTAEERALLQDLGVNLQQYIHYNAWTASLDKVKISEIKKLPFVRYIGPILPGDKITPRIKQKVPEHATNEDGTVNLIVLFFEDVSQSQAETLLTDLEAVSYKGPFMLNDYVVTINSDSISTLSSEDLVQWIEAVPPPPQELNDQVREAVSANKVQIDYGLTGNGVRVGMWDMGYIDTTHGDLVNRIILADNEPLSASEHATKVAGTLGGDGSWSEAAGDDPLQWRGIATEVEFYSYIIELDYYTELESEYDEAINTHYIDLSQNSWGTPTVLGDYVLESSKYDNIIRGIYGKKIQIIFAAGNEQLGTLDGFHTIAAPGGTAKNTITVGATRSDNDDIAKYTYEKEWGSSFGPTDDGRIKPDLMAPGCQFNVYRNRYFDKSIWTTIPYNPNHPYCPSEWYCGGCGTSMSAPVVSGAIALMLEQFGRGVRPELTNPLPSTLKAILIHTAKDINDFGPDFRSGYGRINVTTAIDIIRDSNNIIVEDDVSTGQTDTYIRGVSPGTTELKVTLVWDDEPGTPGALKELINDLDLVLTDPCGIVHYPWLLDHNNPANPAATGIDRLNNVEQVYITNPISGIWHIDVTGYSVPNPPQQYSLVDGIYDYDADGIPNTIDNCPSDYNPGQEDSDGDGIGDECECDAANIDGINPVNFDDLAILAAEWLMPCPCAGGDTNRDDNVDFRDLAQIAQHWLTYCE